jgi:AcrR family transcriptional regulator
MKDATGKPGRKRRRYDSPLRRQRAAETRERIVAAGAQLIHGFPIWNWDALTVRGVARRARVNERTVYRHFANERELRDAVLARLQEEAQVDLGEVELEDLQEVTKRIFEYVSSFPMAPRTPKDPTLTAAGQRQRAALLATVARRAQEWSEGDRALAAAVLDVLWSMGTYERLVADWALDPKEAIRGATWVIGLVQDAIRQGRRPDR